MTEVPQREKAGERMEFAMQFTVVEPGFTRGHAFELIELARMADDYGLHSIGVGDTGFRLNEAAARVTLLALGTKRTFVGMRPTNPWTRDPQITAAFLATIDSMTEGHAFMEIATGDSAAHSIGRKPSTRARLEEYVSCVRDVLATGHGRFEGRDIRSFAGPRGPVRISIGAEGPRMLRLAGGIGDAVSIGTGLTPEVVGWSLAQVEQGARVRGRDPAEVEPWFTVRSVLDVDRDAARGRVRASLASILHHSMRHGVEGRLVPTQHHDAVREYVRRYVLADHQHHGGANDQLMERLGLTGFAMRRWGMAGDPADWVERIRQLRACGVRRMWLANRGSLAQLRRALQLFGEDVLSSFGRGR
ncbi:flavin-dependent oxidoreductase, F420-dependent methylene-tetrahydromethanopterin reductase [Saccharomonospora marina XMU15]|uniref:Flavin-dependent oxidoreductase, F420-dependent methylene-tetrahydromethanopterin reductase n=1 Tax=Saccharomonospora marina XMU15 TaxID=882083 RepID=H5X7E9_9PSEU|nr:LLM class flavin-dependent oxidoreductase [Saccharomonospora marina]EHR50168.1 flavin-dependent oxidoreductase, F420-dependent methylene-tetrahydromethanopterin reductase [Saccharomonospora marina XMU15]